MSETGHTHAGLRRTACMHTLDHAPATTTGVGLDAGRRGTGEASRADELVGRQVHDHAARDSRGHRPDDAGFVKTTVRGLEPDGKAQPRHALVAGDDAAQQCHPRCVRCLGRGEHRRNDHRTGMDDRCGQQIVELEAVYCGAVAKGGLRRWRRASEAQHAAWALAAVRENLVGHDAPPRLPRAEQRATQRIEETLLGA